MFLSRMLFAYHNGMHTGHSRLFGPDCEGSKVIGFMLCLSDHGGGRSHMFWFDFWCILSSIALCVGWSAGSVLPIWNLTGDFLNSHLSRKATTESVYCSWNWWQNMKVQPRKSFATWYDRFNRTSTLKFGSRHPANNNWYLGVLWKCSADLLCHRHLQPASVPGHHCWILTEVQWEVVGSTCV